MLISDEMASMVNRSVSLLIRLQNDLYYVRLGVKLYSLTHSLSRLIFVSGSFDLKQLCEYIDDKVQINVMLLTICCCLFLSHDLDSISV